MLRKTFFALTAALMLAAPAVAEEAAQRAEGMEIREGGVVLGRVSNVERDAEGRIVSIAAVDLEAPADAPPYLMAPRRPGAPLVIVAAAETGVEEPASAPRAISRVAR